MLYGANGAGKSNLVRALSFLRDLINEGTEPKEPIARRPFLLDRVSAAQPTAISVQFVESGRVYALGVKVTDKVVTEEWLSLIQYGAEVPVFQRFTNDQNEVTIEAGAVLTDDSWGTHQKVVALTKVGVLPNQLFLHAVGQSLQEKDQGPVMVGALRWFAERLAIVHPSTPFKGLTRWLARNPRFSEFAGNFLRRVATGVDRLRTDSVEVDEKTLVAFSDEIRKRIAEMTAGETIPIKGPDGSETVVEKCSGTSVRLHMIQSEHLTADGDRVALPFPEESDGTQRLTHLLPALHSVDRVPAVFIIDEIDRSLHPLLAKGFVRAFLGACAAKGGQLIFTTHETAFLDLDLLRRDEIWFADKKRAEGTTELYSLSDFKVRTDLKVDKAYLQGRFEAVPPIEAELPAWVNMIIEELKPRVSSGENVPT